MSSEAIVAAWKHQESAVGLEARELAILPPNPAGSVELSDLDLDQVSGGDDFPTLSATFCNGTCGFWSVGCCPQTL